jgi:hypothetical protein
MGQGPSNISKRRAAGDAPAPPCSERERRGGAPEAERHPSRRGADEARVIPTRKRSYVGRPSRIRSVPVGGCVRICFSTSGLLTDIAIDARPEDVRSSFATPDHWQALSPRTRARRGQSHQSLRSAARRPRRRPLEANAVRSPTSIFSSAATTLSVRPTGCVRRDFTSTPFYDIERARSSTGSGACTTSSGGSCARSATRPVSARIHPARQRSPRDSTRPTDVYDAMVVTRATLYARLAPPLRRSVAPVARGRGAPIDLARLGARHSSVLA